MDGITKLKKLVEGQEDGALRQVVDYLCSRKDLSDKYLNPEKDLNGMASYIRDKSMAHAKNGWNFLNDKVVYSWAVTYFLFSDSILGIKKAEEKKKKQKKEKVTKVKDEENATNNNKVFKINDIKRKEETSKIEQITLFGGEL